FEAVISPLKIARRAGYEIVTSRRAHAILQILPYARRKQRTAKVRSAAPRVTIARTMTTTVEPQAQPARADATATQRQFVNFMFFKVDRALRHEPAELKQQAKREFAAIVQRYSGPMMIFPYSTVGLKSNVDFMLWRIGYDLDP